MARSTRYSCLARPDLLLTEYRFHIQYKQKRASGNKSKIFITIKRSIQTLWLLRTITLAWCDQTSSSPSINSTSTIWKRVSRNSCKILITIQRSNQNLWPVRPVTLAWRDQTSSSPSIDSASTIRKKGHLEIPVKFLSRSNGRFKRYGPFEPLLEPGSTRHPPHRVSIPNPLYGKGHPEIGPPETPIKFRSRSNGRIKSYCLYEALLLPGATRTPPHRVWIPHPLNGKKASGNSSKILVTIQRSVQNLWHVRTITLACRDQTSSSMSIDSTSTIWKRAS
jgi:hypothetical protein